MAEFDAVVVGSGPNGLVAAITLARAGWSVTVLEAAASPGGGTRTEELIRPGMLHDVCSTVHPLALASEAMRDLPLSAHGVEWIQPEIAAAHPLDGGRAGLLFPGIEDTVRELGPDGEAYRRLVGPHVRNDVIDAALSPTRLPTAPIAAARFGLTAIQPLSRVARSRFSTDEGAAVLAGCGAHSMLRLDAPTTAGYGVLMSALAHLVGWPVARGGSQAIAAALVAILAEHGGTVQCNRPVRSLADLPSHRVALFDLSPVQLVEICGDRLPAGYRSRLTRFRPGPGVWKVDYALDGPVPWTHPDVGRAGTVHLGGTLDEVAASERDVVQGRLPDRPFVLYVQASGIDPSRVTSGGETGWAYCHVPNGCEVDMTDRIEAQIERFAPGFRDRIVERHVMGPAAMRAHNDNYRGGDINGGAADLRQFVARPVLSPSPWATPLDGVYLCSASTPPGGGVHGMCGLHAARAVLRKHR